jgi:uncharacterized protein YggE
MRRVTFLGILLVSALGVPTMADDDDRSTISVTGTGRVSAAPDVAEINLGVVTQAQTARDALRANNEAMARLIGLLKERGVAAKDIQTTNINVHPQYSQPPQPVPGRGQGEGFAPKIVGYNVNNTVQVTARNLEKLGELLDAVVQAGANQMNGISFRIDKPDQLLDQARKSAVADARRKAQMIADEAGVVLGRPVSITESGGGPPPQPMFRGRMMMAAAEAVPVAGGEQELSLSVSVVYELKESP